MKRLALFLVLVLSSSVVAQPRRPVPADRREQIKKRIRIMRANELTEELAPDEATAGKLFPLLAKYDDELDKLLQAKVDVAHKLAAVTAASDPKATDRLVDDAIANQKALWSSEERRLGELRKILTPAQVAKLLVVLPALERKIQNQLRKAIENAGARATDDDLESDETPPRNPRNPRRQPPPPPPPVSGPAKEAACDPFGSRNCKQP